MESLAGIVLAAGAGTRFGRPKALAETADGTTWLTIAVELLRDAGCGRVIVVLGARASEAPLPASVEVVVAEDWASGMSASLRAGLVAASGSPAVITAALLTLVDLPELPLAVVQRVAAQPVDGATLRQAVFEGRPGHPVLIGRDHWAAISASVTGDSGARRYLAAHHAAEIECGDLFDGHDVDR
jgi:CTP:molybdopterin cytidylyltransferase MocA